MKSLTERNKKWIRLGVLLLISAMLFCFFAYRLATSGQPLELKRLYVPLFTVAVILALCFITLLYWLSFYKNIQLKTLFLVTLSVLMVGYMVLFAPVTVPDEQAHYISAYRMSNFFLFHWNQASAEGVLMRQADADFFGRFASSGMLDESKFITLIQSFSAFTNNTEMVPYGASVATSVPLGYLASAFGIALGRALHLGAVPVFYLGRMFNMAEFAFLMYFAVRRTPVAKNAFCVIALFPMTIHVAASYSYDGMVIGVSALLLAEILRMFYGDAVTWKQMIYCFVLCAILAPSKMVYTPLICLVLLVPSDRFRTLCKRPWMLKCAMILAGILGLLVMQLSTMSSYVGEGAAGSYIAWADEEGYTLSWALGHIVNTIGVFLNTILQKTDYYVNTMLGSSLGWFQLSVPQYFYLPFAGLFLVGCMKKTSEPRQLPYGAKCWTFLMVAGSAMLILASMFLSWTPISSTVIEGVQGRYFLPLLPAVILLLRNDLFQVEDAAEQHTMVLAGTLNVFVLAHCFLKCLNVI